MIASPTPSAKRTAINIQRAPRIRGGISAVESVNAPHHSLPQAVRALRGPSRTAIHPASTWDDAYPIKETRPVIHPSCTLPRLRIRG